MEFGFLIDKTSFQFDCFKIAPKEDFENIIRNFYNYAEVSNGWFYGPKITLRKSFEEKIEFKSDPPIVHSSFFKIGNTHIISSSQKCTENHLRFLILGYGFLQGLYLIPEGWSNLRRTAYKPSLLNALYMSHNDYHNGMAQINSFYLEASEIVRKNMYACIHWFLLAQSYEYEWDRFDAQYKVLDGLFNIYDDWKVKGHTFRPKQLAEKFNIDLPEWAVPEKVTNKSGKLQHSSKLSRLRNDLTHEAIYAGHPIGFNYPEENYSLELRAFNVKLISACLGLKTPYLNVPVDCRIPQLWKIK